MKKKNNYNINGIVIIIKGLSLIIIIMTIKIINNNYYFQIYINELIKIIFKYFRKT